MVFSVVVVVVVFGGDVVVVVVGLVEAVDEESTQVSINYSQNET